jgi:regulator of sirC expression with transglutaminase-like and TPR domain
MQQFNDYFLLREAKRKMLESEKQAALQYILHELKVSRSSIGQSLARVLLRMASRLNLLVYPSAWKVARREPNCEGSCSTPL